MIVQLGEAVGDRKLLKELVGLLEFDVVGCQAFVAVFDLVPVRAYALQHVVERVYEDSDLVAGAGIRNFEVEFSLRDPTRTHQGEIKESNEKLRSHNVKLQQANELLEQLSITDGLTKLHNHRFFQDQLTREINRTARTSSPLSLLLIDIDDFKSLNDRFGHAAGDELLHGIALIMNATVRSSDLLARYGGEEFAVLAPGTNQEGAYQLAEKLRTAIAESSFILGDSMRLTRATVSVGISQFEGDRRKFFDEADRALYRAKAAGKNCVMTDESDDIE